jgi:hypothetical protein
MIQVFYKNNGKPDFLNLVLTNSTTDILALVYTKDWKIVFATEVYSENNFKDCIASVKSELLKKGIKPTKLVVLRMIIPEVYFENESVFDEIFPKLMQDEQIR